MYCKKCENAMNVTQEDIKRAKKELRNKDQF